MKTCLGCGVVLQDNNPLLDGYVKDLTKDYCYRCFKMRNYGEYENVIHKEEEYLNLIKEIGTKNNLVLLVVDLLNIPKNLSAIKGYLKNNPVILVLNKRDLLPLKINDEKYLNYFAKYNFTASVVISAYKNYNLDLLLETIKKYNSFEDVYMVGTTNAGKSSLINKLVELYSINKSNITISPMPSTTLKEIKVPFKDFNLIDTPGLIEKGNILDYVDNQTIKKIVSHQEIKPMTYQLKENEAIVIDKLLRIDNLSKEKNSFTLFISRNLETKKIHSKFNKRLQDLPKRLLKVGYKQDIVIPGLGFIKVIYPTKVLIYVNSNLDIYTRESLIK